MWHFVVVVVVFPFVFRRMKLVLIQKKKKVDEKKTGTFWPKRIQRFFPTRLQPHKTIEATIDHGTCNISFGSFQASWCSFEGRN